MGVHVSTLPDDAPEWVFRLEFQLFIARCVTLSALSIAAYDWFACLDEEVDLIWRASHSVFKYLALFSRYMGLVFPVATVVVRFGDWTTEECHDMKLLIAISSTLILVSTDAVLALRTVAIYSFQRSVWVTIATLLLIEIAATIWTAKHWILLDIPAGIPGCFFRPGARRSLGVSLFWIPSTITDVTVFVLTVTKVFPLWSSSKATRLSWVLLRDEILYYGLVSSLTLATNILMFMDNQALGPIMAPLTLTLSAVLVFHMVLNLRSVARYPDRSSQEAPIAMSELLATTFPLPERSSTEVAPSVVGPSLLRPRFVRRTTSEGGNVVQEGNVEMVEEARVSTIERPPSTLLRSETRQTV